MKFIKKLMKLFSCYKCWQHEFVIKNNMMICKKCGYNSGSLEEIEKKLSEDL